MAKKNYLEKFFEQHNEVKERLTINKKLIILFFSFAICSLLYLLFSRVGDDKLSGDISTVRTLRLYSTIMNVTYLICIVGIIFVIILITKKVTISFKVKKIVYNILDWLIILPICVVLSTFIFNYVFSITEVKGESMYPTIQEGEHLVLNYTSKFKRTDIVVINVTVEQYKFVDKDKYFIKRIIGIPGDEMKFINEDGMTNIYINGQLFEQTFYNGKNDFQNFMINGYSQYTVDSDGNVTFKYLDDQGIEQSTSKIPKGYYFVLGDNRKVSNDSRSIGLIRKADIIGVTKYRTSDKFIFYWRKIS